MTFLGSTNATGTHKLKPLIIGKSKNPRAFSGFNVPVLYKSSKNAWMTTEIFLDWFHNNFVKEVKSASSLSITNHNVMYIIFVQITIFFRDNNLPKKALLLLDNASCHGKEDKLISIDGNITMT